MPMRRTNSGERGASLVEFALIVPLLTVFLFGIVQFGIAYDKKQSINSAAREGARMAAIPEEPSGANPGVRYSTILSRVNASFEGIGDDDIDELTIVVVNATPPNGTLKTCTETGCTPASSPASVSPCTNHPGQTVIVTATKEHDITIPFFGVKPVTLTGKGEFRCEIDG